MKLYNLEIVDLGLYLRKEKILIISDLHIGLEEYLKVFSGMQIKDIIERLKKIISKVKIEKIIINGDLKHEFGKVSEQEWNDVLKLIDFLKDYEIILVKGNHDNIVGKIVEKRNIKLVDFYKIGDKIILHGDKIIKEIKDAKMIIIGHEHPAIIFEERKFEKYKCFLVGKWKGKKLIVMPSMNPLIEGTNIKKDKTLSPFLKQDLGNFIVYVVEDKVYDFGKLKDII